MTRVIVVDDDIDTIEVTKRFLTMKGLQVIAEGYNGKEAIDLYQKLKPDVLCIDITMPHYDGIYAIENIRRLDKDAKIIAVTGSMGEKTKGRLHQNNISHIFYKPINLEHLVDYITELNNKSLKTKKIPN